MPASATTKPVSAEHAKKSGTALYTWRRSMGINRETFARLANCSERTLATYEKQSRLPTSFRPQVNEAIRLVKALLEIIPNEELSHWLQAPNSGFDGQRPSTVVEKGERDLIWEMIHQTRHAAFA